MAKTEHSKQNDSLNPEMDFNLPPALDIKNKFNNLPNLYHNKEEVNYDPKLDLTFEQLKEVELNIKSWKKDNTLCDRNNKVCQSGIDWVIKKGLFPKSGGSGTQNFESALSLTGGGSLTGAFESRWMLGVLACESSFGKTFPPYKDNETATGGFQIKPIFALAEYNKYNKPLFKGDEIDGNEIEGDYLNASKVASWYMAWQLQQLTLSKFNQDEVGPVTKTNEAILLALASYNKGITKIQKARMVAKKAGKDNTIWNNVKTYLTGSDVEASIYVAKAVLYGNALVNQNI